jgi:hypothetical protein
LIGFVSESKLIKLAQIPAKVSGEELFPPHTGNYMVAVPGSATSGPEYSVRYNNSSENSGLLKNRLYRASVWVANDVK